MTFVLVLNSRGALVKLVMCLNLSISVELLTLLETYNWLLFVAEFPPSDRMGHSFVCVCL